jgi:hypothetical protein
MVLFEKVYCAEMRFRISAAAANPQAAVTMTVEP